MVKASNSAAKTATLNTKEVRKEEVEAVCASTWMPSVLFVDDLGGVSPRSRTAGRRTYMTGRTRREDLKGKTLYVERLKTELCLRDRFSHGG